MGVLQHIYRCPPSPGNQNAAHAQNRVVPFKFNRYMQLSIHTAHLQTYFSSWYGRPYSKTATSQADRQGGKGRGRACKSPPKSQLLVQPLHRGSQLSPRQQGTLPHCVSTQDMVHAELTIDKFWLKPIHTLRHATKRWPHPRHTGQPRG